MHLRRGCRKLHRGSTLFVFCVLLMHAAHADSGACAYASGLQTVTVTSDGRDRTVAVCFPQGVPDAGLRPLVIDLHGSESNGEDQAQDSGFRQLADEYGVLVATPDGAAAFDRSQNALAWNIPGVPLSNGQMPAADLPDDVQFIDDLIQSLTGAQCADPQRVFAAGQSGGGRMASLLGCKLASRIAAIAPVAGIRAGLPAPTDHSSIAPDSCVPERAVPVLSFHGTGDPVNPFAGGGPAYWGYSVEMALHRWANINGCELEPEQLQVAPSVTRIRYGHCRGDAEVVLYVTDQPEAEGGGHIWPGSAAQENADPAGIKSPLHASELILKFFQAHPLTPPVH